MKDNGQNLVLAHHVNLDIKSSKRANSRLRVWENVEKKRESAFCTEAKRQLV
jgi:hypothetical protein